MTDLKVTQADRDAAVRLVVFLRNNAPTILELVEENARLREALGQIARREPCHCMSCSHMGEMARQALKAKEADNGKSC